MTRLISHSEATAALTCQAQHAFRYTGALTDGDALRSRTTAPLLRDGRAWGAGVAAFHEAAGAADALVDPLTAGGAAIIASLAEDYEEQKAAGTADPEELVAATDFMLGLLEHYAATTEPLPIDRPEHELEVRIPSRRGHRRSNLYRLLAYVDGIHTDEDGRQWLVEYKLRTQLSRLEQIVLSRQLRWYAWGAREALDIDPVGVIVDERLKETPKPPRIVNAKRKGEGIEGKVPSHAADQLTTPALYIATCEEYGVEPAEDTVAALGQRRWQLRERVIFRPGELDEAGLQLVSSAQLIHQLDSGQLFPVRNPSRAHCPGCSFRDICPNPDDRDLVDVQFERVLPKRDRQPEEVAA